jgi:hypothetical protein
MSDSLIDVMTETDTDAVLLDDAVDVSDADTGSRRKKKGMTKHGFRVGSDSAIIVDLLVAGGLDRQDINEKVAAAINPVTRSGRNKNIPSLISGLLARLEERGYTIESSWRLVPPADQ